MDLPTPRGAAEGAAPTDGSAEGIDERALTFGPDGAVVSVSAAAAAALGAVPGGLVGTYLAEDDPIERLREEVQRTGNTLRSVVHGADGRRYAGVVAPGGPDGVVCTLDDEPAGGSGAIDATSLLFAHAPIGMGLVGADGVWLHVNRALCTLTGHDRAALAGLTVQDLTVPEDRFADFVYQRQLETGELTGYQVEQRWLRADGEAIRVLVAVTSAGDRLLLVQVQDITARHEAEARACLLADLVDSSVDAMWARDGGGELVFWNRAAAQLLGYAASDLVGAAARADLPESRVAETAHVLAMAAGGRSVGPVETIRRHKDGHDVEVALTVSPILDTEGGLLGFASVARALDRTGAVSRPGPAAGG